MKLSQLDLGVGDLARSEAFYRDVLGLETRRENGDVRVRWPEFLLVLSERPPASRGKFRFGFRVESSAEVDAFAELLRAAGVQIISGPAGDGSTRRLFFLDPDEYEIEIFAE